MKVLLTKAFLDTDIAYLKERISKDIELIVPTSYTEDGIAASAASADVLFGGMISRRILEAAKKIKFIQIPWTGVDNLDFDLLNEFEVTICNSHSNSGIVAEHAIALMFAAAKKIPIHDQMMRNGDWNRIVSGQENLVSPFSRQISNSNVALIGFGAIGQKIFEYLRGFDCQFNIVNRTGNDTKSLGASVTFSSFKEVNRILPAMDYVFVAAPLTQSTNGFVDADFFKAMNKDGILINVSRGEVINEDDLYYALKNFEIAGAGIDTWFNYPSKNDPKVFPSKKYDFQTLPNLVLSPHRAGYIDKGFPHLDDAIENLNRSVSNQDLKNVISLNEKY